MLIWAVGISLTSYPLLRKGCIAIRDEDQERNAYQALRAVEQLLQVGGRCGVGGTEVEGAEAGVCFCRPKASVSNPEA